ncbi:hypothetical protein JX265_001882 [Neoarthrinium moseri]|uniref:Glutamine-dependent NAD(+) synthetase n=1 Tax=Neoarthrinium moseri TaxID=1658444 RepID=A0A9Q0AVJ0_9PEZI|nr:hypothetical protein JX265_001882 [Neoarthrinium moseri]
MSFVTVAAASLPSVPLDFEGNRDRILESIRIAKEKGARLRTGPELEIPGYGCLDHHLEGDTFLHSWEVLAEIISDPVCKDMLIDLGLGVRHRNVRYNCRVLCTYRQIFFIRPKQSLANDGLYREMRHFTAWAKPRTVEDYYLEQIIKDVTGQKKVPIGDAILSTEDTAVGCETCEELFTPRYVSKASTILGSEPTWTACYYSPRSMSLPPTGAFRTWRGEIILNSSASHAELRKLRTRLDLISNSTRKLGGVYCYSNASGVDGEARMMYDASSMVLINGKVMAQSSQFTLKPVDVITATIDIEEVRSFRSSISRNVQAAAQPEFPRIECDIRLSRPADDFYFSDLKPSRQIELKILDPMEEMYMAEAVYLWQYLTRANAGGYFLALSGGLDSCSVATFVFGMARLVLESINAGEKTTLDDLRRVTGEPEFTPKTPQEILGRLLHTCYMGTKNSSTDTRSRAQRLAQKIGAYHSDTNIDETVDAMESIVDQALNFKPKYQVEGGSVAENLAKQNIQARNRMVYSYALAQLSTTSRGLPRAGSSLLLLRGYLTKYDASSGDLAPLGSISKSDAKSFLGWAGEKWDLPILKEFLGAIPTAELLPLSAGVQSDEEEMGLSYDQLSAFGKLRKVEKLGPWSAYLRLLGDWKDLPPRETAELTKRFFRFYAMNRHKATTITPSIHLSAYNPDDNRHDLRPFLYKIWWPYQFSKIDKHVKSLEERSEQEKKH